MTEFVHLHNHSDYSLLDGAAPVDKMVRRAVDLGMKSLAITDHGNMFGAMEFYNACNKAGIKPILGIELYVAEKSRLDMRGSESGNPYYHLIVLARNQEGYKNLLALTSASFIEGFYYKPRIDLDLLATHSAGLIGTSACIAGQIPAAILRGKKDEARTLAAKYGDIFGKGNFFLELQDHGIAEQKKVNPELISLGKDLNLPCICTNDMHYIFRDDWKAHDILLCIGTNTRRDDEHRMRFSGPEYYMKSPDEMATIFGEVPATLKNTVALAEMIDLTLDLAGPKLPEYEIPEGFGSPEEYLKYLVTKGVTVRYPNADEAIHARVDFELGIITSMGFAGYFLIVWDFIRWARESGISVGPGRGSGASSIVAYCLRITDIDPLKYNLLFERFLNPERISLPDFDVDFADDRRAEVIEYVTQKYGTRRTGQIITFGTMKAKAAVKDVARAMGIAFADSNSLAKLFPSDAKFSIEESIKAEPRLQALAKKEPYDELFALSKRLEGKNRHSSIHPAGIVIGRTDLVNYVPLYKDSKTGNIATQYTMEYLEDCGLVKMDILGLRTLSIIVRTLDYLAQRGITLDLEQIPEKDQSTFDMLGRGDSACVFQFESAGMRAALKKLKPEAIEELIALSALYRPGPIENIDKFIDCKRGKRAIKYLDPSLEECLKETYGVIVYQEQVMQIVQKVAGYSLGKADLFRRAIGKKQEEVLKKEEVPFIEGALKNGYSESTATRIFKELVPFAGYGFNKTHAAAYTIVAYRTAYLKAHYPAEFMAANLASELGNRDKLAEYMEVATSMGLAIEAPDINLSQSQFAPQGSTIRFGFLGIKGVGTSLAQGIVDERTRGGPYLSFVDFLARNNGTTLNRKSLESLVNAGCFDSLDPRRATLAASIEAAMEYSASGKEDPRQGMLFDFAATDTAFTPVEVEEYPKEQRLALEMELLGAYFSGDPSEDYELYWNKCCDFHIGEVESSEADKTYTAIAMVTELRSIKSKAGEAMAMGKIKDRTGIMDFVVFPKVFETTREHFSLNAMVILQGTVDLSRSMPSFRVSKVLGRSDLDETMWNTVHIRLRSMPQGEQDLFPLRDILVDHAGKCSVLLHVPTSTEAGSPEAVIEAGVMLSCSPVHKTIELLSSLESVLEVWRE